MTDKQTISVPGGDVGADKAPAASSDSEVSVGRRRSSSDKSAGRWAIRIVMVVMVVAVAGLMYLASTTLNLGSDPEGLKVRRIASTATEYLSNSPDIISAKVTVASTDNGGPSAYLDMRLRGDTSPDAVANLPASTRDTTFGKDDSDTRISLAITLSWTPHGTNVSILASDSRPPDRPIIRHDLAVVDETRAIEDAYTDCGRVTTLPTTFLQPSLPHSSRTFTIDGWKVISTSSAEGQFPTTVPFEQVTITAGRVDPADSIDLDGDTLFVTSLVTDNTKDLAPKTATPVVRAATDYQSAGLTTLQLGDEARKKPSSDDL